MFYNILYYSLMLLNFLVQTFTSAKCAIHNVVNKTLENKVIYYALYSKHDQYYVCLYDYRSFWDRLWFSLQRILVKLRLDEDVLFSYNNVAENVENLTPHMIDVAIIAYLDDGKMKTKMFINQEGKEGSIQNIKPDKYNYVYVIAEDENEECMVDLTACFNAFKDVIAENHLLTCIDFINIFIKFHKACFNKDAFKHIKLMRDDTFTEVLFKDNDIIEHL